jgi:hypothetical protein
MRLRDVALIVLLLAPLSCLSANNDQLREIMYADQADRQVAPSPDAWKDIAKRDAARRVKVQAELAAGRVHTSADFYNAALVMQHGDTLEEIRMAHALATIAASIDPLDRSARWLKAASWDRLLLRQKKPQWYGTQYIRDASGKWALYEMDESAVTDTDRIELAAPTLAEAKKRVEVMNGAK